MLKKKISFKQNLEEIFTQTIVFFNFDTNKQLELMIVAPDVIISPHAAWLSVREITPELFLIERITPRKSARWLETKNRQNVIGHIYPAEVEPGHHLHPVEGGSEGIKSGGTKFFCWRQLYHRVPSVTWQHLLLVTNTFLIYMFLINTFDSLKQPEKCHMSPRSTGPSTTRVCHRQLPKKAAVCQLSCWLF